MLDFRNLNTSQDKNDSKERFDSWHENCKYGYSRLIMAMLSINFKSKLLRIENLTGANRHSVTALLKELRDVINVFNAYIVQ